MSTPCSVSGGCEDTADIVSISNSPIRVLVRNAGFVNLGAAAMLLTVADELRRRIGNVYLYVDRFPAGTESSYQAAGIDLLKYPRSRWVRRRLVLSGLASRRRLDGRLFRNRQEWIRPALAMQAVDAVVDISGFAYGDVWGETRATRTQQYAAAAYASGKPCYFLPQTWGPFENSALRRRIQLACRYASAVYARDQVSYSHLQKIVTSPESGIAIRPDIAFLFQGHGPDRGAEILGQLGMSPEAGAVVGVAPNRRVYDRTRGTGIANLHIQQCAEICRAAIRMGLKVALVPHEIAPGDNGTTDDVLLCSLIQAVIGDPRVQAVGSSRDPRDIKSVIANLTFLAGARFHALVAALSQDVPVMALGWSHKYRELLGSFGLDSCTLEAAEVAPAEAARQFSELFEERDAIREAIREQRPSIEAHVDTLFKEICTHMAGSLKR